MVSCLMIIFLVSFLFAPPFPLTWNGSDVSLATMAAWPCTFWPSNVSTPSACVCVCVWGGGHFFFGRYPSFFSFSLPLAWYSPPSAGRLVSNVA
jgi:hypothetical protein